MNTRPCRQCGLPLTPDSLDPLRWLHPEGGESTMLCHHCGHHDSLPNPTNRCPRCEQPVFRLHHRAEPILDQTTLPEAPNP